MSRCRNVNRQLALLAGVAALAIGADRAPAQQEGAPHSPPLTAWSASPEAYFETMLARLDASSFPEREEASLALELVFTSASICPSPMLGAALNEFVFATARRGDLSIEQRTRLMNMIQDRFNAMPRGGMGIRWDPRNRDVPGQQVVILETIEPFPCHELGLLFPRDIITGADGMDVRVEAMNLPGNARNIGLVQEAFRYMILSHPAGSSIRVSGLRPIQGRVRPEPFEVDVPLGRYEDLNPRGGPQAELNPLQLEFAWRFYARRHALPLGEAPGPRFALQLDQQDVFNHREPPRLAQRDSDDLNLRGGVFNPGVLEDLPEAQLIRRRNMHVQRAPNMRGLTKVGDRWELQEIDGRLTPVLVPERPGRWDGAEQDLADQVGRLETLRAVRSLLEARQRKTEQIRGLQTQIQRSRDANPDLAERLGLELRQAREDLERLDTQLSDLRDAVDR